MSWNYRVIKRKDPTFNPDDENTNKDLFGIYEVFYDKDGCIKSWSEDPIVLGDWETLSYLEDTYGKIGSAFAKPVLNEEDLPHD